MLKVFNMTDKDKDLLERALTFIGTVFGETNLVETLGMISPEYIIEKYAQSIAEPNILSLMHPKLKDKFFDAYLEKWRLV